MQWVRCNLWGCTMKKLLLPLSLILLSGCATIIRGTEQQVTVNTNPPGAKVDFSNGQSCQSPCTIKSKRDQSLQITLSKEGCQTQTATMVPSLAGGGVILGGLIDYGTGAVYDLQPNPLTVTMFCERGSMVYAPVAAPPPPPPPPAPEPKQRSWSTGKSGK